MAFVVFKKFSAPNHEDNAKVKENSSVFIVFLNESTEHKDAVLKLASVLQADYHIKVSLDLYEKEKIYSNPAEWFSKVMTSCEKILIIWSPGAEVLWKSSKSITNRHDMFTPVLRQLDNDLIFKTSLKKYVLAYFSDCQGKDFFQTIPSNKIPRYKLMEQLEDLSQILLSPRKYKNGIKKDKSKQIDEIQERC